MPRKIFLSFLGVSNYEPVSYYMESGGLSAAPLEKYVQMTLLRYLSDQFSSGDAAFIFVTKEAKEANWLANGHKDRATKEAIPSKGLEKEIEDSGFSFSVRSEDVSSESKEADIWDTFQKVMGCIAEGDEIYLDITHSWRYLPMLAMTLLNYAKVVKGARVGGIYYGALERLGTPYEVAKMPMTVEARPVPILELTNFSLLQDWTVAADDFIRASDASRLRQLADDKLKPILLEAKGQNKAANNLRDISKQLEQLIPLIQTNRGNAIWNYSYGKLQNVLAEFNADNSLIKPMADIVAKLAEKTEGFTTEGSLQWLEAVRWCYKHGWIQQGITQLQEGILAWLCEYCEYRQFGARNYFDKNKEKPRNLLSSTLNLLGKPEGVPEEDKWYGEAGRNKTLVRKLIREDMIVQLAPIYSELGTLRNDISHGGYTNNQSATSFSDGLEKLLMKVANIVESVSLEKRTKPKGLLNLSNHPSSGWSSAQKKAAKVKYKTVTDFSFPNISPTIDEKELNDLVESYVAKIRHINPLAVHLMGEMTFTFALVQRLQAIGIPCIASTSERMVEEREGQKIVTFRFVQFRAYG